MPSKTCFMLRRTKIQATSKASLSRSSVGTLVLATLIMTFFLRNYAQWLLFLLFTNSWLILNLAKTMTASKVSSEDNSISEYNEHSGTTATNFATSKARSLTCLPMLKYFEVQMTEILKPGEAVGLTGDHIKLGNWQIDKSLEMKRKRFNPLKWYLKIFMCTVSRVYYRFFIYHKDTRGFKRIRFWESQQHARVLEAYEIYSKHGSNIFGQAYALAIGGGIQRERGWLRKEYILQFKFIWPQHIRFTAFSHFIRKPKYIVRLKALANGETENANYKQIELQDIEIQVSCFVSEHPELKPLRERGVNYQPGDVVVFHTISADYSEVLYALGIYTYEQEFLGEVIIPVESIKRSEGILELPIFDVSKNLKVGWLTLPFLRIQAFPQSLDMNMRASFHHYWPSNWPTLDIGHRGLGKSYYFNSAGALENTIDSFLQAKDAKSDMIYLNVQLTKDYVPVVWHDFGFFTASSHNNKKLKSEDLSFVYIHDLTYQELLRKRVFMLIRGAMVEITLYNTVFMRDKERIFPKLLQVFQQLPSTLGVIVNVKWPQLLSTGVFESLQRLDKNRYVDEVLRTSLEFGCGRALIMASYDADICTLMRFKQHMFPVIFQTAGLHNTWGAFADLRTHSLTNALQFVQASDILGTAVNAKEISRTQNKKDLSRAYELQQVVFVWGDQLNDYSLQDYFRSEELAGLIYDQLDTFMFKKPKKKRKRFAFFEAPELQRIFARQCIAAGNSSINEGPPDTHSPFWPRFRSLDKL